MKFGPLAAAVAGAALAGAVLIESIPASAQDVPSYAQRDEVLHGVVESADGYDLVLRDARGFQDRVKLHDGTIINPTGLKLARGQSVTIHGRAEGNVFAAAEIDTPYHYSYAYGYPPPYYYGPYAYPGPYYGYPYAYGPAFGFGLGFRFR